MDDEIKLHVTFPNSLALAVAILTFIGTKVLMFFGWHDIYTGLGTALSLDTTSAQVLVGIAGLVIVFLTTFVFLTVAVLLTIHMLIFLLKIPGRMLRNAKRR